VYGMSLESPKRPSAPGAAGELRIRSARPFMENAHWRSSVQCSSSLRRPSHLGRHVCSPEARRDSAREMVQSRTQINALSCHPFASMAIRRVSAEKTGRGMRPP